ncbi:hypothetical protein PSTG_00536 [Puccinia striiformis f. sp. tritici PST-78]|uniref:DUF659 domain-containing protein n=1 Tax=Puccinia striiformis f. sp. tritici PST-78 TaxID=1165861 RepID=A0A0L0W5B2_9BASI|nr:hypothetical protein PSTG_00536 [Puccinia striiformis f. sp. tritici PST-78]
MLLADASHQDILHPTVVKNLPSVKVLSRSVHMLYTAVQDTLKKNLLGSSIKSIHHLQDFTRHLSHSSLFRKSNGVMYIGADAWQSPNGFDILGVVIYQLVELAGGGKVKLESMPLDFVQLAKSHTDNASNNLVMVLEMKKFKWARFKGDQQWIRCNAHILNLISQSILRPFGLVNKRSTSKASAEDAESSSDNSEGEDAEGQIYLTTMQPIIPMTTMTPGTTTNLFTHMVENLSSLLKTSAIEFVELCREFKCDKPHSIVQDVSTRWNSTLDQLGSIVRCQKAIMAWQKDKKHGLDRKHHILHIDIQLANHLVSILQVFYKQMLQVSTPGSAWLTHIIVFIDEVTALLSNAMKCGGKYPPALQNAC